jgi:hypothetical protein
MKLIIRNLREPSIIELYSIDGKVIYSDKVELNNGNIFIPPIEKGAYLLRIKNKRSISTSRFYKK